MTESARIDDGHVRNGTIAKGKGIRTFFCERTMRFRAGGKYLSSEGADQYQRALALPLQYPLQKLDILGKGEVQAAQFIDLADRMHDRCVVATAKLAADFRQ